MMTPATLYELNDQVKQAVTDFCLEHDVNATLPWIMLKQQAVHELRKLDNDWLVEPRVDDSDESTS
tara:strand:+ start:117 stop:314 length:198 start_codon:yes stop_codon:yes gene_type:complete